MEERPRHAQRVMSVFDVTIGEAEELPTNLSTRVLQIYDEKEKKKEFTVLNSKISKSLRERIEHWLSENLDIDRIINGSSERAIHAEGLVA